MSGWCVPTTRMRSYRLLNWDCWPWRTEWEGRLPARWPAASSRTPCGNGFPACGHPRWKNSKRSSGERSLTANQRIRELAAREPKHKDMGCTGEMVVFADDRYAVGHVGDSRVYLFRGGRLRQVTKDHSFVQEQVDQGLLTPEQARVHAYRHMILRALGMHDTLAVDLISGKAYADDLFLLCSDGLFDMVEDSLYRGDARVRSLPRREGGPPGPGCVRRRRARQRDGRAGSCSPRPKIACRALAGAVNNGAGREGGRPRPGRRASVDAWIRYLRVPTSSFTAATDLSIIACSSALSLNSMIFSTPPAPRTVGTPTKYPFTPNSPFR